MKTIDIDSIAATIAAQIIEEEVEISKSEKERQDALSKEIKGEDLEAPPKDEDDKSRLTDEGEEDDEGDAEEEAEIDPKPKPGADEEKDDKDEFEVDAAKSIPRSLSLDDLKDQINNLRAGKSLKDEAISGQLEDYFKKLGMGEEKALYVFLSSLAAILTGGTQGEEAPRPESMGIDINMTKKAKEKTGKPKPGVGAEGEQAPIIVGEIADTSEYSLRLLEIMTSDDQHRCQDGRMVKFGSKSCIRDLQSRIEDTTHTRDSCANRSADRASLNGTLKFLRQKLRAAEKIVSAKKR